MTNDQWPDGHVTRRSLGYEPETETLRGMWMGNWWATVADDGFIAVRYVMGPGRIPTVWRYGNADCKL